MIIKNLNRGDEYNPEVGIYRVGSGGFIQPDGNVVIGCHRKTVARVLGLQPPLVGINPYFEVGRANEAYIQEIINASSDEYNSIIWEPNWEVVFNIPDSNIVVKGHPDGGFVKDGKTIAGIELKAHSSGNSLYDPFMTNTPKPSNLLQAGTYSYFEGVPFYLFNKAYTKPNYVRKGYKFTTSEKEFKVYIDNDRIVYKNLETEELVETPYTVEGILDYYKLCQEMIDTKDLYRDPLELKFDHLKYCTECQLAHTAKFDFDKWKTLLEGKK